MTPNNPSPAVAKNISYHVNAVQAGERLDVFLAAREPGLTRSRLKQLINDGRVLLDGAPGRPGQRLRDGQRVTIEHPAPAPTGLRPEPEVAFGVLFEDPDIIVIDKPAGLVVHPAAGNWTGTLVQGLLARCPDLSGIGGEIRPGIVHRLDKDTSGVMVAAKNEAAMQALVGQFKQGRVGKVYLGLVRGWPRPASGEMDAPIGRHPVRRKKMAVTERNSRPARTLWRTLKKFEPASALLELTLMTGRTHQIRVHLAHLGHPILGDGLYGGKGWAQGPPAALIARQMLHSHRLSLTHPASGQPMSFTAPMPADMAALVAWLEQDEGRA